MKNMKLFSWISAIFLSLALLFFLNKDRNTSINQSGLITSLNTIDEAIVTCFKSGNTAVLAPYFSETVSISIADEEDEYLAVDAVIPLKDFFTRHVPKTFAIKHQGKNKNGMSSYWIGDYTSKAELPFRIYILSGKGMIEEIEISGKKESL